MFFSSCCSVCVETPFARAEKGRFQLKRQQEEWLLTHKTTPPSTSRKLSTRTPSLPRLTDRARAQASPALTAELTLRTLRRRVPPAVPGVFFLSGGQSEEDATVNLDLINRTAAAEDAGRRYPWSMSFSFGRSLQASVLKVWKRGEGGRGARLICAVLLVGRTPWAVSFWSRPGPPASLLDSTLFASEWSSGVWRWSTGELPSS